MMKPFVTNAKVLRQVIRCLADGDDPIITPIEYRLHQTHRGYQGDERAIMRIIFMNKTQFLCATGALSTLFCAEAQAYVDPGSGAAIITAVLGAIGAIVIPFASITINQKMVFKKGTGISPAFG